VRNAKHAYSLAHVAWCDSLYALEVFGADQRRKIFTN
jgi:hypothetical protein